MSPSLVPAKGAILYEDLRLSIYDALREEMEECRVVSPA